jgi:DeoR/GlpR family transcriptional regulator of sugar metabolism
VTAPHPVRLGKAERRERIVAELRAAPTLRVARLAAELGVSTETVRRDLDAMGRQGLISRTYGGAVRPFATEPAVRERHAMLVEERSRIAREAARRVRRGEVLMIGGGATTVHVARRIATDCRELTVITHSFGVATVLSINPTLTVLMTPGRYDALEGCVFGPETTAFLAGYHANRAILGASGLAADGACDVSALAAAVYRAMLDRAAEAMVVADHGKFGERAMVVYGRWREIGALVTDRQPQGKLLAALRQGGVEIAVAGGGGAPARPNGAGT